MSETLSGWLVILSGLAFVIIAFRVVVLLMQAEPMPASALPRDNSYGRIRYEKWDAYTPAAHLDDRFTCSEGCFWSRMDGAFGHGAAPISWHRDIRVTRYINPPYAERPSLDPKPVPSQGATR